MTATDLYEIVRDVPAQAAPDGLTLWTDVDKRCPDAWIVDSEIGVHQVSTHHAAMMFVGSMTAWLMNRNVFGSKSQIEETYWTIDMNNLNKRSGNYRTLVAALAAACKEVK